MGESSTDPDKDFWVEFHNRFKISGLCHLTSTFHQYIQIEVRDEQHGMLHRGLPGCPLPQVGGKQVDEEGGAAATPPLYVVC